MSRARGADFSSAQSVARVDAVAPQLDFAFVKLTEGTGYVNPFFGAQLETLHRHRVLVGVYHFLAAGVDGARQWDWFQNRLYVNRLPRAVVACDYEAAGTTDAEARAFIARGRQRGYRVGLYGSAGVARKRLGQAWTWAAWWSSSPPPFRWDFWQFTNSRGEQDFNVFRGDKAELSHWWGAQLESQVGAQINPKVRPRWWLHDETQKVARGPFATVPVLAARFAAYAVAHPRSRAYTIERA